MRIAIHAADLDHERIDGTRVYLANMLKNFGALGKENQFDIYHCKEFNPRLAPPTFQNYLVKKIPFPWFWTQTRFAWQLFWDKPDVLWMPVHNVPIFRRRNLKIVVTIHDLAFKIFPEYFTKKDLRKLNRLSDLAIRSADKIIAVSDSTKKDILKFYPEISEDKITVIHHGFDTELFSRQALKNKSNEVLKSYFLKPKSYLLYVGAIQPRKNLETLVEAFEKTKELMPELKLVLAGAPAWKAGQTLERIGLSPHKNDIIVTGTLPFDEIAVLYQNSFTFIFPSLYEGFGIPVLEAFASGVPVIVADNSSLVEVAGESALFFETGNAADLGNRIARIINDENLREELVGKGKLRVADFSWQKCAKETLGLIAELDREIRS